MYIKDLDLDFVALPETAFPRPIFTGFQTHTAINYRNFRKKRSEFVSGAPTTLTKRKLRMER